jgi:hypothetical protein
VHAPYAPAWRADRRFATVPAASRFSLEDTSRMHLDSLGKAQAESGRLV